MGGVENVVKRLVKNGMKARALRELEVLILEEVSMVSGPMLDVIDAVLRGVRGNDDPFGGVKVVAVGDFYQLPPPCGKGYAFESEVWKEGKPGIVDLQYKNDSEDDSILDDPAHLAVSQAPRYSCALWYSLLNRVRVGKVDDDDLRTLNSCVVGVKPLPTDGIMPTRMYCRNVSVRKENERALEELEGGEVVLEAVDSWDNHLSCAVNAMKEGVAKSVAKEVRKASRRATRVHAERTQRASKRRVLS